jgi:hypothetical protein
MNVLAKASIELPYQSQELSSMEALEGVLTVGAVT